MSFWMIPTIITTALTNMYCHITSNKGVGMEQKNGHRKDNLNILHLMTSYFMYKLLNLQYFLL